MRTPIAIRLKPCHAVYVERQPRSCAGLHANLHVNRFHVTLCISLNLGHDARGVEPRRARHRSGVIPDARASEAAFRLNVKNDRMHQFSLVALLVIVGGFVLAWPLGRVRRSLGDALSLVAHLVARVAVIVISGFTGVRAVSHGTLPDIALAVLLFALAAGGVFMFVVLLVGYLETFRGDSNRADP